MFLQEANVISVVQKQYFFKLKANYGVFTSLLMTQLFAILFSAFMGTGQSGTSIFNVSLNINYYTGNMIIIFTMIWAFTSGITLNSKASKDGDFAFVSNRLTSNLSNIAFLMTATAVAGLAAMFAGSLLKVIVYYYFPVENLAGSAFVPFSELVLGVVVSILYVSLFGALGYLVGALIQMSKLFVFLLPLVFIGLLFIEGRMQGDGPLGQLVQFFALETSPFLFLVKAMAVIALLFLFAIITDKMEVRK